MVQPAGGLPTYDPNARPPDPNAPYIQQPPNTYGGARPPHDPLRDPIGYTGPNYDPHAPWGTVQENTPDLGYEGHPLPTWAGRHGGAEQTANDLAAKGQAFQTRDYPDLMNAYVQSARDQTGVGRGNEQRGMDLLHEMSEGRGPSAATIGMGASQDQNLASKAAAAHMGGGLGGATAMQAGAGRDLSTVGAGATGVLGETNRAGAAYMGGMTQLGNQDMRLRELDQGFGLQQLGALDARQQQNDSMQLAYQQMAQKTLENQLNADERAYGAGLGDASMTGIANYNNDTQFTNQLIGGTAGALSGGLDAYGRAQEKERAGGNGDSGYGGSGDDTSSDARVKYDIRPQLSSIARYPNG